MIKNNKVVKKTVIKRKAPKITKVEQKRRTNNKNIDDKIAAGTAIGKKKVYMYNKKKYFFTNDLAGINRLAKLLKISPELLKTPKQKRLENNAIIDKEVADDTALGEKKVFGFMGQEYFYTDNKEGIVRLAKLLNIHPKQLLNSLRVGPTRIFVKGDKIAKIDISKSGYKDANGILAMKNMLGIKNFGNWRALMVDVLLPPTDFLVMDKLNPEQIVTVIIRTTAWVAWHSNVPSVLSKTLDRLPEVIRNRKIRQIYKYLDEINSGERTLEDIVRINPGFRSVYHNINNRIRKEIDDGALVPRHMERVVTLGVDQLAAEQLRQRRAMFNTYKLTGARAYLIESEILTENKAKLELKDGYLMDHPDDCYRLDEWANIEYETDVNCEDTCVVRMVRRRFPQLYKKIKKYETDRGVRFSDYLKFCKENKISTTIYDNLNKIITEHLVDNHIGSINAIVHNHHIYPISGRRPVKKISKNMKIQVSDDEDKLLTLVNKKKVIPAQLRILPARACTSDNKIKDISILSYVVGDKKILFNPEYEKCKEFLTLIHGLEYLTDDIRFVDIPYILEKMVAVPGEIPISFMPEKSSFVSPALVYQSDTVYSIDDKDIQGKDKNKCYSWSLYSLEYLLSFDYRTDNIIKINKDQTYEIKQYYEYIVIPDEYTNALPCTMLYEGEYLIHCRDVYGLKFTIVEEMQCKRVGNYFRDIMDMTMKFFDDKTFKNMWNIFIGGFEKNLKKSCRYVYKGIYDKESEDYHDGFTHQLGDHTLMFDANEKISSARDRIPLAVQVKNYARRLVIDEIRKMGIPNKDIVLINTDAIYYKNKDIVLDESTLDEKEFGGWKKSCYMPMHGEYTIPNNPDLSLLNLKMPNPNKRVRKIHMKYAGAGKTRYITKKLVPSLKKRGIDYIILTPSHKSLAPYKDKKLRCTVIQDYVYNSTRSIPWEQYIIIDEVGMLGLDCHDILYKMAKFDKDIECFGDFNQLLPVGQTAEINKPWYINYVFDTIETEFINYRNDFTEEYYESLIKGTVDIKEEIVKYSTEKPRHAEKILCYTIETKNKYNARMLKYHGHDSIASVGAKIICVEKHPILQELGVYNKKELTVDKSLDKDGYIRLIDDRGVKVCVTPKLLKSYFEAAYAINIHQAQGDTLKSYYWAKEDNHWLDRDFGNRLAYTVISRIKN